MININRRDVLKAGAAAAFGTLVPGGFRPDARIFAAEREKLPVAGVVSVYHQNSHADVIIGKVLEGYRQDGGPGPDLRLVSLYVDQFPINDMSRKLAEKHRFRLAKTIDEAVTLGTDQVQVAGVLSVGEHGNYPEVKETKQVMFPRRRFFDEIVATFRRCKKVVPVFNDKHLSYRWEDARHMFDTSREMKFPFVAGSTLALAWRNPELELPRDCEIESALSIGYGGLEAYGFHSLEGHQGMIERRRGGETGVAAVQAVSGSEIRKAEAEKRWSSELFAAALKTLPGGLKDSEKWVTGDSAVYLLEHRDGLKSAVVMANGLVADFAFAVKLKGHAEPLATRFKLHEVAPFCHFAYLLRAIDYAFHTGKEAYPLERTLLTTGILDRVMHSLGQGGKLLETPELDIKYAAPNWPYANHPDSPLTLPND